MNIEINDLSKEALAELLSFMHKEKPFPDELFTALYRKDLTRQVRKIAKQLERVEKQLENKKLSRKAYQVLVKKYHAQTALGNKKLAILKELDNAAN